MTLAYEIGAAAAVTSHLSGIGFEVIEENRLATSVSLAHCTL